MPEKAATIYFHNDMAQEIEIKLPISDLPGLRRALLALRARPVIRHGGPRVHELNVLFDTPGQELAKRGQLLRIRRESPAAASGKKQVVRNRNGTREALLTFKRPVQAAPGEQNGAAKRFVPAIHKIREEVELKIADAALLTSIFEGLGMSGWFRYEKFRTTYRLPASTKWAKGLLIELDETPIGIFVELEGPAGAIDRAARELGFSKQDYIVMNYFGLYLEECRRSGKKPGDMVFETEK